MKGKPCPICGKTWCFCESHKFKAEVSHVFYGRTLAQANRALKKFYNSGGRELMGASMATYPGSATKNEYDKGLMKEIVRLFVSLRVSYGYTEEAIQEELNNLFPRIEEEVSIYYQELNAEMAYERAREEGRTG